MDLLIAIISPALMLVGTIITVAVGNSKTIYRIELLEQGYEDQKETAALFNNFLNKITTELEVVKTTQNNLIEEVRKHNEVITRTFNLEKAVEIIEEKQKVANHRIDDLEDKVS